MKIQDWQRRVIEKIILSKEPIRPYFVRRKTGSYMAMLYGFQPDGFIGDEKPNCSVAITTEVNPSK
jgi:hypothetical protein